MGFKVSKFRPKTQSRPYLRSYKNLNWTLSKPYLNPIQTLPKTLLKPYLEAYISNNVITIKTEIK